MIATSGRPVLAFYFNYETIPANLTPFENFLGQRKHLGQIGALIESPALYGNLTAVENLLVDTKLMKLPQATGRETRGNHPGRSIPGKGERAFPLTSKQCHIITPVGVRYYGRGSKQEGVIGIFRDD